VATDSFGNPNLASTSSDNSVTFNAAPPTVTINQASGQTDPSTSQPINFTVVFSEAVIGLSNAGVTIGGTAPFGTKNVVLTGSGNTYNVAVSGMTGAGTVTATIPAAAATSAISGLTNQASTSTDNIVTFNGTAQKKVRGQITSK
jgi:trimeric autotransporter adhesin